MKRNHVLILAALLVGGAASGLLAFHAKGPAQPEPAPSDSKPPALVVHEWGTFTSFSGADGKNLRFPHKSGDLPNFVYYTHDGLTKSARSFNLDNPISLETPVLYFYPEREMTASVTVDFPQGLMTEWYPLADGERSWRRAPKQLNWKNIKLLPNATVSVDNPNKDDEDPPAKPKPGTLTLPKGRGESHYYAARETDAAPLQIKNGDQMEQEKFLFYRGVADFAPPLSVTALGNNEFKITNHGKGQATGLILVQIARQGTNVVGRAKVGNLDGGASTTAYIGCKSVDTIENIGETMVRSLVEAGLYEKEARAMVKTWKSDWFADPGTRLLYVAPTTYADEMLPLKIEPKPTSVVRVLVGRHDIITPEQERDLDVAVKELEELRKEYETVTRKLETINGAVEKDFGRFRSPALDAASRRLKEAPK